MKNQVRSPDGNRERSSNSSNHRYGNLNTYRDDCGSRNASDNTMTIIYCFTTMVVQSCKRLVLRRGPLIFLNSSGQ